MKKTYGLNESVQGGILDKNVYKKTSREKLLGGERSVKTGSTEEAQLGLSRLLYDATT